MCRRVKGRAIKSRFRNWNAMTLWSNCGSNNILNWRQHYGFLRAWGPCPTPEEFHELAGFLKPVELDKILSSHRPSFHASFACKRADRYMPQVPCVRQLKQSMLFSKTDNDTRRKLGKGGSTKYLFLGKHVFDTFFSHFGHVKKNWNSHFEYFNMTPSTVCFANYKLDVD